MRLSRSAVVVVVLSLVAPLSGATPVPDDDGGTGADASNSSSAPTLLPAFGNYAGRLRNPGDADWFTVANGMDPVCVAAAADGLFVADVTLAGETAGGLNGVTQHALPSSSDNTRVEMAVAFPMLSDFRFGFAPFKVAGGSEGKASTGGYAFSLQGFHIPEMGLPDAGFEVDAGPTVNSALPVPGPCFSGKLQPLLMDAKDTYVFDAQAGDRLIASLAHAGSRTVRLDIVSPAGTVLASGLSGDIVDAYLPVTGTYTLSASQTSTFDVSYLIGLTGPGPEPRPCQPSCS